MAPTRTGDSPGDTVVDRTVFLSSTGQDLQAYRDAVARELQGYQPWRCVRMEDFNAHANTSPIEFCRAQAAACTVFVGIIGHCYGSIPPGETLSFTEQEYDAASMRPRLVFVAPDDFPVPMSLVRGQGQALIDRQTAFRAKVAGGRHLAARAEAFATPQALATAVVKALRDWEREQASEIPTPQEQVPSGVDPTTLADCRIFRDLDAPWSPVLVVMPAGEFRMGAPKSDLDRYRDRDDEPGEEEPQHLVRIVRRFALGRYPITFSEFDRFCADTGHRRPSDEGWGRGRRPVINVSWNDAQQYVAWLSRVTGKAYRLPTEAEWEYCCRAGTTTKFSCGDRITIKHAHFNHQKDDPASKTAPVGSYPANPWGLYDMHGNVWEQVEDVYHPTYEGAPTDGSAWIAGGDPAQRVVRGGSFGYEARDNRSSVRCFHHAGTPDRHHGIRVARTL